MMMKKNKKVKVRVRVKVKASTLLIEIMKVIKERRPSHRKKFLTLKQYKK